MCVCVCVCGACIPERMVMRVHDTVCAVILCSASLSREINYQLFSLILVVIFYETEYVRVFCYVSYVLENSGGCGYVCTQERGAKFTT